jgi:hypothetical protein
MSLSDFRTFCQDLSCTRILWVDAAKIREGVTGGPPAHTFIRENS